MTADVREALAALRTLVEQAKTVPMTSNAIVGRAEALALIDAADAAVTDGAVAAQALLADARVEAGQIEAQARERAAALVAEDAVVAAARQEADALAREADAWAESRLAALASSLEDTLEQVATLRARLSGRAAAAVGPEADEPVE